MITVPYLTPDEALSLIRQYKGTKGLEAWTARSEEDRKAALLSAMLAIDRLPFAGRKSDSNQTEAFPRVIHGQDIGIPDDVKLAVTFHALGSCSTGLGRELDEARRAGVSSYSLDDFSVSFRASSDQTVDPLAGMSAEVLALLKPYLLLGGVMGVYE